MRLAAPDLRYRPSVYRPCISTCSRSFSSTIGTEALSLVRLSTHTPKWPGSAPGSLCNVRGWGKAWVGCPSWLPLGPPLWALSLCPSSPPCRLLGMLGCRGQLNSHWAGACYEEHPPPLRIIRPGSCCCPSTWDPTSLLGSAGTLSTWRREKLSQGLICTHKPSPCLGGPRGPWAELSVLGFGTSPSYQLPAPA